LSLLLKIRGTCNKIVINIKMKDIRSVDILIRKF